jgi:hypothetical protein
VARAIASSLQRERERERAQIGGEGRGGEARKKGVHPALQFIRIISPHGRLVRVLAAKAFKLDRPTYVRDPGKQSETVGQLAKFKRRFEFSPKVSASASEASQE